MEWVMRAQTLCKYISATTLFAGIVISCTAFAATATPEAPCCVHVEQARLFDSTGKELWVRGINVVPKNAADYVGDIGPQDFATIRSWGMNTVRLGIFWDGLEPHPGQLDTAYLDRISRLVAAAKAQGLFVLLDMHQDLYSVKFSDGAPRWATQDEDKPNPQVTAWSDAYYGSPAVQAALDHFWANSPGPDGVGLQDHYARVWQFVAERFRDEPAVLGYDLMNEPFPGRDAGRVQAVMMGRLSELLAKRPGIAHPSATELLQMEANPAGRQQITQWLSDMALFSDMLTAGAPIMQDFERHRLMPFYTKLRAAIRARDPRHILFLETAMSSNMGIPTAIEPLVDAQGQRDPQQVFSPHVYDIVVDTALLTLMSPARVALTIEHHRAAAQQHHWPTVVGEWGAFYLNPTAAEVAREQRNAFEQAGFGHLYWDYQRTMKDWPGLSALTAPRPAEP
jgi:endoglycosylceramidase